MSPTDATPATTTTPHAPRHPGPEHARLDIFVGTWRIEGANSPHAPAAPNAKVNGEQSYEWLPGNFFLLCRWHHETGLGAHTGTAVMGWDPAAPSYTSDNFDNLGYHRTYHVSERHDVWTFMGRWERATFAFADDGATFTVNWEISTDGSNWGPLCELRGTKLHG